MYFLPVYAQLRGVGLWLVWWEFLCSFSGAMSGIYVVAPSLCCCAAPSCAGGCGSVWWDRYSRNLRLHYSRKMGQGESAL